jgi:hypothetical protein
VQEGGKEAAGIAGLPGQHMFCGRHKVEPGGFGVHGAPLADRVLEEAKESLRLREVLRGDVSQGGGTIGRRVRW